VERSAAGMPHEVIVVDNASSDGSAQMVRDRFPGAILLENDSNLGFSRGNNQALAVTAAPFILLLNPDAQIQGDSLPLMVRHMEARPEVGVLGPQLLNPDGTVQSSRRRFPTLATGFVESTVLQQWFPRNRVLSRYYMLDLPDDEEAEVDWVVGACMMVRREAYREAGPLDEGFFMYSEELDWCYRIKGVGWNVAYFPSARVVHHEGKSSEQIVPQRHIRFQTSKVRFFRKHHGRFQARLLRAFLLATYVYQWAREGLKWIIGHRRPLRARRLAAFRQVLRSGLRETAGG
jgi:GT2 family glycosyltransferase